MVEGEVGSTETGWCSGANWIFGTSFDGVIPIPARFSRVRDLAWLFLTHSAPMHSARDPSLRLKNGYGQDDSL